MLNSVKVPRPLRTAVLLLICLLMPACGKNKVTKANYDKITNGMSLAEVEAILGKGKKEEGGDGANVAAQAGVALGDLAPAPNGPPPDVYLWEKGTKQYRLTFVKGQLIFKQDLSQ